MHLKNKETSSRANGQSSTGVINVVIAGRPNVGKSSIFNRLLGRKRALVLDTPGVTRDRIVEPVKWWVGGNEISLNLIDTGGLGPGNFEKEIRMQVQTALEEANVVLFVMNIREGLTLGDQEVYRELRKSGIEERSIAILGVLNKGDSEDRLSDEDVAEQFNPFYELGLDHLLSVSAEHALGFDELKDKIVELASGMTSGMDTSATLSTPLVSESGELVVGIEDKLTEGLEDLEGLETVAAAPYVPKTPSIAIVGQPNVGKSTLLNAICGENRTIVSPIAGTTVDAIDTKIHRDGKDFILIDTAGIRRKNKTEDGIEVLSVVQSRKTLERADLALLVLDGEKGVYDQDEKIAGLIEEAGCSVILVLNKWDTQKGNYEFSQRVAEETIRKQVRFLGYAPVVFTTAIDGRGLDRLFRMIQNVIEQRTLKISTRDLSDFIRREIEVHNPFDAKFYLIHQAGRNPPTFVAHVSDPKKVHFSLSRRLVKTIREKWGFLGSPIRFHFLKAKNASEKK